ncbi:MAG: glycosyltransferase [Verrucomicrobiales bacterium]|nr:glycosyltransferase [Verrucomicrobiales bacterium]
MSVSQQQTDSPLVAVVVISDLEFGGAQRQVVELANSMNEHHCRVYVVSLADYVPLADSLRDREERFKFILRRARFDFTVVFRLARFLRQVRADIVHSYLFDATIAARLAGRLARRPVVIDTERNTDYILLKRKHAVAFRLTRWCHDMTIANSRAGAAFNSRVLKQPLSMSRVVYNGVDTNRFQPHDESRLRAELGIGPDELVVGMFASFKPQKNHPLLLKVARKLLDQGVRFRLLLVGDELYKGMSNSLEFKQQIQKLVDDLKLRPHCIFAGNRKDVERYYNVCHVTALPSLFEGTPNVALESMASGVPVVATNVADNAYIVPDGRAGFIVELNDEETMTDRLVRLLKDKSLRASMSQSARAWMLEEFSCARLAEKTLAVYREAVQLRAARE